ncbi:MAG TPA: DUF5915 domain-containing protein [Myxococcota bacterium]|nr:DUF5915 domain-containing protein [Myxococcota bacterium]
MASVDSETVSVSVTPAEGWVASAGTVGVVILDATLTDALIAEGRAREVLSRIQGWRKEQSLDYTARISVTVGGDPALVEACRAHAEMLAAESLAVRFEFADGGAETAEVDGLTLQLGLSKA